MRRRTTPITAFLTLTLVGRAHFDFCRVGLPDLVARVEPSVVSIEVENGRGNGKGSGFVVDGNWIVTNYHVIEDAKSAKVIFADKSIAAVLGIRAFDADRDIAVLEIDDATKKHLALRIRADLPRKGETAVAFGGPMGLAFTVSQGNVSGIRKGEEIADELGEYEWTPDMTWIQTTTPISPGNSGGPLVGADAAVIGVNTWTYNKGQNLNFAVASTEFAEVLKGVDRKPLIRLSDQTARVNRGARARGTKASLAYVLYALKKFEPEFSRRRTELEAAAARLQSVYVDVKSTSSVIREAESRFDICVKNLEQLSKFNPGVPKFFGHEGSIIGEPGKWYVLQVLGSDSALVKPSRNSAEVLYLTDVSMAGIADGVEHDFGGLWYSVGETHSYETVGGAVTTVYVIHGFADSAEVVLQDFHNEIALPAVAKVREMISKPQPPRGDELVKLTKERAAYRKEQVRLEEIRIAEAEKQKREREARLKREEEEQIHLEKLRLQLEVEKVRERMTAARRFEQEKIEAKSSAKLKLAMKLLESRPAAGRRWLAEILKDFPDTIAAVQAEEMLNGDVDRRYRKWSSGNHSADAIFVGVIEDHAVLRLKSGKRVRVPLSKLSESDQKHVYDESNRRDKELN